MIDRYCFVSTLYSTSTPPHHSITTSPYIKYHSVPTAKGGREDDDDDDDDDNDEDEDEEDDEEDEEYTTGEHLSICLVTRGIISLIG